uniref:Uncharacterized protein n=1 Tax=viral metagenome TaxID=1070528 RepID=A0A6C0B9G3_9ZZZZ
MVSIISDEVNNIILVNTTIDDSFVYDGIIPVAVLVEERQHLIAEKLSPCFKIKEACLFMNDNCPECSCYCTLKFICCLGASFTCGYLLCACPFCNA